MINRILMRRDEKRGGILVQKAQIKYFPLSHSNLAPDVLNIWVACDFGYVVSTRQGGIWICNTEGDLINLVKEFFDIKDDVEFLTLKQVSYTEFRGEERSPKFTNGTKTCPCCGSDNTIGHGRRRTLKYIQKRRLCNSCSRTWISEQKMRQEEPELTIAVLPEIHQNVQKEGSCTYRQEKTICSP